MSREELIKAIIELIQECDYREAYLIYVYAAALI